MPLRNQADHSYDVVVVGARVAGAATAHLLARSGLRVLLSTAAGTARTRLSCSSTAAGTAPTRCRRTR